MNLTTINPYQNAKEGMAALQVSNYGGTEKTDPAKAKSNETITNTEFASSKQMEIVDSYLPSTSAQGTDSGITISNATYSNITNLVQANKQASSQSSASIVTDSTSSNDEEEEETTTETITKADGSVYEKTTTTTADGQETVTLVKISDGDSDKATTPNQEDDTNEMVKHFEASI